MDTGRRITHTGPIRGRGTRGRIKGFGGRREIALGEIPNVGIP